MNRFLSSAFVSFKLFAPGDQNYLDQTHQAVLLHMARLQVLYWTADYFVSQSQGIHFLVYLSILESGSLAKFVCWPQILNSLDPEQLHHLVM